jgi:hypothetical protein
MENGLSYFQTGGAAGVVGEENAEQISALPTRATVKKTPLDQTQTADLLANMQAMIYSRQGPMASFNRGLERAAAWGSGGIQGPSAALNQLNIQEQADQKNVFEMRKQMAAYKAAQAQAERFQQQANQQIGGGTATIGGAVNPEAQMPPQIRQALQNAASQNDQEGYYKIFNTWAQEQAKIYANPAMDEPKIPVVENVNGQWVRRVVSTRDYRANPDRYRDTPQTQAAIQSTTTAPVDMAPGTPRSVRQNNPGNLVDKNGVIRTFASLAEGEKALEDDLKLKLSGQSPAVKERFGPQVGTFMSPALLAETWAPSTAKGNTVESTQNYGKAIAKALGMDDVTAQIPNTPEALAKAKAAIAQFEAGSAPITTAPVATPAPIARPATAAGPRPSPGQLERQEKIQEEATTEFATGMEKANATRAQKIDESGQTAPERFARFNDIVKVTEDPEMQKIFGALAKKGLAPFVLRTLEEGVNAGQFGTLGVANLERNLMIAGANPDQIKKLLQVEKHLAQAELEYAKTYLQGQGAVSDNERRLVKAAVGKITDPATVLKTQAKVMAQRADFDSKIAQAYDQYRATNGDYAPFNTFMRTAAKGIINEHNEKMANILNTPKSMFNDPINSRPTSTTEYKPGSIKWGKQ